MNDMVELVKAAKTVSVATELYVQTLRYIQKCPFPMTDHMEHLFSVMLADSLIQLEDAKRILIEKRQAIQVEVSE